MVAQRWDARDTGSGSALVDALVAEGRDLDLVLAAAGILGDQEQAEKDPTVAVEVLQTNLVGLVAVLLPLAAALRAQGHGHLVVFSSVAGLRGRRANYVYGASKAGLDAFAEGLSAALAGSGVTVTVVRPGFVTGRMTQGHADPAAGEHAAGRGHSGGGSHPAPGRGCVRPGHARAGLRGPAPAPPARCSARCPAEPDRRRCRRAVRPAVHADCRRGCGYVAGRGWAMSRAPGPRTCWRRSSG